MHDNPSERGATTAEYAVGVVAATGFAGGLFLITPLYFGLVRTLVDLAVRLAVDTVLPG